jgi:hypothetical protein
VVVEENRTCFATWKCDCDAEFGCCYSHHHHVCNCWPINYVFYIICANVRYQSSYRISYSCRWCTISYVCKIWSYVKNFIRPACCNFTSYVWDLWQELHIFRTPLSCEGPVVNGVNVSATLQIQASTILLLPIIGSYNALFWVVVSHMLFESNFMKISQLPTNLKKGEHICTHWNIS